MKNLSLRQILLCTLACPMLMMAATPSVLLVGPKHKEEAGNSVVSGGAKAVVKSESDLQISADEISYSSNGNRLEARGNVTIRSVNGVVKSDVLTIELGEIAAEVFVLKSDGVSGGSSATARRASPFAPKPTVHAMTPPDVFLAPESTTKPPSLPLGLLQSSRDRPISPETVQSPTVTFARPIVATGRSPETVQTPIIKTRPGLATGRSLDLIATPADQAAVSEKLRQQLNSATPPR